MRFFLPAVVVSLLVAAPASAEVKLAIAGGRVTLTATDATMSQILAEWARVGQTKIVNGERVVGTVLSLELTNMPEADALEIILRSVSGYLLALRPEPLADASQFDRILILPTSAAVRPAATVAAPPPAFPRPQFTPAARPDDDPQPPIADAPPVPGGARPPAFTTFPQPAPPAAAPPPSTPTNTPTMPSGVRTPGMVVPAPTQPGQPAGSTDTPRQ